MSAKKIFTAVALSLLFAGCASHSMMRGSVAMKISKNQAHVCLGNEEVKIGDKVSVFKNVCPAATEGGNDSGVTRGHLIPKRTCTKQKMGNGTVTDLLNEHYSEVTFDDGVAFNEGSIVELNK